MYKFFTENNLVSLNQSGFKPGDSWMDQLLFVTHEICKSFGDGFEIRGIFVGISEGMAQGVLVQTKKNGIFGKLFDIIADFLYFRKETGFWNGQILFME